MSLNPEQLERRVKSARELAGLSQRELGEQMKADGLGIHDVGKWERQDDTAPPMSPARAHSLAFHTGVPSGWFFEPDLNRLFGPAELPGVPVNLERDVAALRDQVRELAEILGEVPTANTGALDRLLGQLDATDQLPLEELDEGKDA